MNQRIDENAPIKGNAEAIELFTDTILKIIGMYVQQQPTTMIDYFLTINNVHKLVIHDLAARWALDSHPEEQTYRMAERMFRESMREMRRALPLKSAALDRDTGVSAHVQEGVELFNGEETLPADTPSSVTHDPMVGDAEPTAAMVKHVLRYGGGRPADGDEEGLGTPEA